MQEQHRSMLTTKLSPPPFPSNCTFVPRLHLYTQLKEGTQRKLTLVSAPAGSGKTTLLSEWARLNPQLVAWVSLDRHDNEPGRFWCYVNAALRQLHPELDNQLALYTPGCSSFEAHFTALLNAITSLTQETTLVLDNYHLITNEIIHNTLSHFLDHLPAHMHLIIALRTDAPFSITSLRIRGQIFELHTHDLCFTAEETRAFLADTPAEALAGKEWMAELMAYTEGWIAALYFAKLALHQQGLHHNFTTYHSHIKEYLLEEVYLMQSHNTQMFLLETAILDRLQGALCDVVTGQHANQATLEWLERNDLFLTPLDTRGQWYRYGTCFRDFLQDRLMMLFPERAPLLHQRASAWYEQQMMYIQALKHAQSTGDIEYLANLIERVGLPLLREGEIAGLLHCLNKLPDESIRSRPRLCLLHAWLLTMTGQYAAVEPWLQDIEYGLHFSMREAALAEIGDTDALRSMTLSPETGKAFAERGEVQGEITVLRAHIAALQEDSFHLTLFTPQAQHVISENTSFLRDILTLNLGIAHWLHGETLMARQIFLDLSAAEEHTSHLYILLIALYNLARVRHLQGQLHLAARTYQRVLDLTATRGEQPFPAMSNALIGLAEVHYEWNDLETASLHVHKSIELGKQWRYADVQVRGHMLLASIRRAQEEKEAVLELLHQAEDLAQRYHKQLSQGTLFYMEAQRATLWLTYGNNEAALRWANAPEQSDFYTNRYLVQARISIEQNKPEVALKLLKPYLQAAESQEQMDRAISIYVLQAIAYQKQRHMSQALATLAHALALGEVEGYTRSFIDEGKAIALLLSIIVTEQQKDRLQSSYAFSVNYGKKLLATLDDQEHSTSILEIPPKKSFNTGLLTHTLSKRELAVLHYIITGMNDKEIAQQLHVSESTIKWHLKNMYGKLHVHNRAQLIVRAQESQP